VLSINVYQIREKRKDDINNPQSTSVGPRQHNEGLYRERRDWGDRYTICGVLQGKKK
jgi:hypothetical protein